MRPVFAFGLVLVVLLTVIGGAVAQSESIATPVAPFSSWSGAFQVRPQVPFVWLRQDPMSTGAIRETLLSGAIMIAVNENGGTVFDGTQWWGFVAGRRGQGWVELNSLIQVAPTPVPIVPARTWRVNSVVRVKASVPFVSLRADHWLDENESVVATIPSGTQLVVVDRPNLGNNEFLWQVRDPNSYAVGFVEDSALEFVRSRPNFPVSPIPPSAWRTGYQLGIKSGVPFVWIRLEPNSNAESRYTLERGGVLMLAGEEVRNDGVQNWRRVIMPRSSIEGWVEENSLVFTRIWTRF